MCFPQTYSLDHSVSGASVAKPHPGSPGAQQLPGREVKGKGTPGDDEDMARQAGCTKFLPLLSALLQM